MPTREEVRATYDRIASHFSRTRGHAWPEVASFVDAHGDRAAGGTALDVGCGNGRHAELLARHARRVVGVDASRALLFEAHGRASTCGYALSLIQGDAAALPVADDVASVALYVATLHHLPTATARRRSLAELARVLEPGGVALVSVWSATHERFDRTESFDTTVDWTLPGGERVARYYHIYAPAAFRAALADSPLVVHDVTVSSGNCYATVGVEGKGP